MKLKSLICGLRKLEKKDMEILKAVIHACKDADVCDGRYVLTVNEIAPALDEVSALSVTRETLHESIEALSATLAVYEPEETGAAEGIEDYIMVERRDYVLNAMCTTVKKDDEEDEIYWIAPNLKAARECIAQTNTILDHQKLLFSR